jgi:predicted Zn-dependent protease
MADQTNIMASHPRTADRIQRAIQEAGGTQVANPIVERNLYLQKINGMLYGDSAEEGFILGRRFAHPKLRFAFTVPPGFYLRNSSAAVVAQRADGSGIIFDRAPKAWNGNMVGYLLKQWAPGAEIDGAQRIEVNGMEGATGTAQARTSSGVRDVRLVAIRFADNQIYRFLFVTKPAVTADLAGGVRDTVYSFRQLSASEAAELKPQRIQVIKVAGGDTPESLAARMPFEDYRLERFLVLNGLQRGAALQPGQLVKIIAE